MYAELTQRLNEISHYVHTSVSVGYESPGVVVTTVQLCAGPDLVEILTCLGDAHCVVDHVVKRVRDIECLIDQAYNCPLEELPEYFGTAYECLARKRLENE